MTSQRSASPARRVIAAIGIAALLTAACGNTTTPSKAPTATTPPATTPPATTPPTPTEAPLALIPQPAPPDGLPVAPEAARVDLTMPTFSNPTNVTNPLFPVSAQASVLMLGRIEGKPFRTEVTLLPTTRIIEWQGQQIETLVSQYAAYLDGRITEIAYDFYAQDDAGAVWYFGEDVFDFVDGAIVTTEGTWLAGKDGPAAMIMPAAPKVGDVYRPENVPGFVFEEVTVTEVGRTLDGPLGSIAGGLITSELHADGTSEDKIFAPGYGEFLTGGGTDYEGLALAVPTDASSDAIPVELVDMGQAALEAFTAAGAGGSAGWSKTAASVATIRSSWAVQATRAVPAPIQPLLTRAIDTLAAAAKARDVAGTRSAAIETARLTFDLQLRHRPTTEVDLARFGLWAAQVIVDVDAGDAAGVNAAVYALDYLRDRFIHTLDAAAAVRLNAPLNALQSAVKDDDLQRAATAASEIRVIIADFLPEG